MSNVNSYIQTFSGGEFGGAMSARVAIDSYQASCELMENWIMAAQGPMTRRPSLEFIDGFIDNDLTGVMKGFEFDVGQNYLLLLQDINICFYLNDGILDIDNVTSQISNGSFANFTGWTDNSESGASATAANGQLNLTSNGAAAAKARTTFTVNEANSTHILSFDVRNGPVALKIGTSAGDDGLLKATELRTGHHRLEFTPTSTGTTHLEISHDDTQAVKLVDNVQIITGETVFTMPAPWITADLRGIFTAQDGDRLYMFHRNYPSRVLERRGHRSWSLIYFEPDDGPFDPGPFSTRITPSAKNGTCTLTANEDAFDANDARRLIRLTHQGQYKRKVTNHAGSFSDPIKVSGIGANRAFTAAVTLTGSATVTLQRSVGNQNDYAKVITVTATTSNVYNDSYALAFATTAGGGATNDAVYNASGKTEGHMDNQTVFYRWAVNTSDYASGTVTMELSSNSGSQTGIARILSVTNATTAPAEVLQNFAQAGETDVWDKGSWADDDEWPNVVAFAHGRLWPFRRRRVWSSVSDDHFSFDDGVPSGTSSNADRSIQFTLRSKSAEGVRWARELDFLCIGTRNEEYVVRSTSAAEPVGPSTAEPSLQGEEGGAGIEAVIGGDSIIYIHRNERRVMQFAHNPRALSEDSFISVDLTRLNPEACEDKIVNAAVQGEPERRIFAVTKSGIVKPALFRREEEIMGWGTMRTQGIIEDVHVLREASEDVVYFIVRRQVNGSWVRMIERLRSEVVLNDEDLVHLDSMLETEIVRPATAIEVSSIDVGPVTITATDDVFEVADEGKILWQNGGQIRIDTFTDARTLEGTILYPLRGRLNYIAEQVDGRPVYEPSLIPEGRWGLAQPTSTVTGLDHLEGETVSIWADMAYRGTAVVSGGAITLPGTFSRIFVGLNFTSIWKSLKLAYGATKGTAVTQPKMVTTMGLVLDRTADTVLFGDTPGKLKRLVVSTPESLLGVPRYFSGEAYEKFNGTTDMDPRIIIATANPGPATIKALIPNVQVNER
jgi:hypothetical protein